MNDEPRNQHKVKKALKIAVIVVGSTIALLVASLFAFGLLIRAYRRIDDDWYIVRQDG